MLEKFISFNIARFLLGENSSLWCFCSALCSVFVRFGSLTHFALKDFVFGWHFTRCRLEVVRTLACVEAHFAVVLEFFADPSTLLTHQTYSISVASENMLHLNKARTPHAWTLISALYSAMRDISIRGTWGIALACWSHERVSGWPTRKWLL